MRDPRDVVIRPIITEKSTALREHNCYVFQVAPWANKIEIKKAVEELYKVTVLKVRTVNVRGKKKRLGRFEGKKPDWKKAICTLKEGDTIEFFEGV